MSEPLMQQIDKHCDLHTFKYWITYEGTVEAHNEEEAEEMIANTLDDIHNDEEPQIDVQWSWR
ncbi:hypothetical protein [Corynebacterium evansiae]|uniref:hypothetical protein n=1 Tax=Corynebacterium evansiae TaxID=2913499 RepID=UPI003EBBC39D